MVECVCVLPWHGVQELYKNLMFLRNFDGDVEDLALSFAVTTGALNSY